MGFAIELNQTSRALPFLLVSSVDHITPVLGATPTVTIRKAGGAFATPAGAITEAGSGWYQIAGNATDANTAGDLELHATATGADPYDDVFTVGAIPHNLSRLLINDAGYVYSASPVGGMLGATLPSNNPNQSFYCTRLDVEDVISSYGVDAASVDDNPMNQPSEKVAWAIGKASERINFKLCKRYAPSALANHPWVIQSAAVLAAVNLMRRRGNPCPESLIEMKNEVDQDMEDIASFKNNLNGLAERFVRQPSMSAMSVDRRYQNAKVRVNPQLSVNNQSQLLQYIDLNAYYLYF